MEGTPLQAGTPPLGRYTPQIGTSPWQVPTPPSRYTPPGQVPPAGILPLAGTPPGQVPPGMYTPWAGTHPPEQCMLGDTGNKRAVRILLECILVSCFYLLFKGKIQNTDFSVQLCYDERTLLRQR